MKILSEKNFTRLHKHIQFLKRRDRIYRRTVIEQKIKLKDQLQELQQLEKKNINLKREYEFQKSLFVEHMLNRSDMRQLSYGYSHKVLIIEDSEIFMEQFEKTTHEASENAKLDIEIVKTDNIADAFALIQTNVFDVILSDIDINGGTMDEVLLHLKSRIHAKILIVSGMFEHTFKNKKFYHHWLGKDFTAEELAAYLN